MVTFRIGTLGRPVGFETPGLGAVGAAEEAAGQGVARSFSRLAVDVERAGARISAGIDRRNRKAKEARREARRDFEEARSKVLTQLRGDAAFQDAAEQDEERRERELSQTNAINEDPESRAAAIRLGYREDQFGTLNTTDLFRINRKVGNDRTTLRLQSQDPELYLQAVEAAGLTGESFTGGELVKIQAGMQRLRREETETKQAVEKADREEEERFREGLATTLDAQLTAIDLGRAQVNSVEDLERMQEAKKSMKDDLFERLLPGSPDEDVALVQRAANQLDRFVSGIASDLGGRLEDAALKKEILNADSKRARAVEMARTPDDVNRAVVSVDSAPGLTPDQKSLLKIAVSRKASQNVFNANVADPDWATQFVRGDIPLDLVNPASAEADARLSVFKSFDEEALELANDTEHLGGEETVGELDRAVSDLAQDVAETLEDVDNVRDVLGERRYKGLRQDLVETAGSIAAIDVTDKFRLALEGTGYVPYDNLRGGLKAQVDSHDSKVTVPELQASLTAGSFSRYLETLSKHSSKFGSIGNVTAVWMEGQLNARVTSGMDDATAGSIRAGRAFAARALDVMTRDGMSVLHKSAVTINKYYTDMGIAASFPKHFSDESIVLAQRIARGMGVGIPIEAIEDADRQRVDAEGTARDRVFPDLEKGSEAWVADRLGIDPEQLDIDLVPAFKVLQTQAALTVGLGQSDVVEAARDLAWTKLNEHWRYGPGQDGMGFTRNPPSPEVMKQIVVRAMSERRTVTGPRGKELEVPFFFRGTEELVDSSVSLQKLFKSLSGPEGVSPKMADIDDSLVEHFSIVANPNAFNPGAAKSWTVRARDPESGAVSAESFQVRENSAEVTAFVKAERERARLSMVKRSERAPVPIAELLRDATTSAGLTITRFVEGLKQRSDPKGRTTEEIDASLDAIFKGAREATRAK